MYTEKCGPIDFNISGIGSTNEYYDAEIVFMKVDEFLSLANHLVVPRQKTIDYLKTVITKTEICPPLLKFYRGRENIRVIKHEGRHRALMAKELGVDVIPVAIVNATKQELIDGCLNQHGNKVNISE